MPTTRLFVATVLLVATPAYAQDRTAAIDSIFSFATAETPGCAVGVSQGGRVIVNRAYGLANVERRVFALGSDGRAVAALMQQGERERNLPKVR